MPFFAKSHWEETGRVEALSEGTAANKENEEISRRQAISLVFFQSPRCFDLGMSLLVIFDLALRDSLGLVAFILYFLGPVAFSVELVLVTFRDEFLSILVASLL